MITAMESLETGNLESPIRGPQATRSLARRQAELANTAHQLRLLGKAKIERSGVPVQFQAYLDAHGLSGGLHPSTLEIFQINLGKLCNMTCKHCHVDAGPDRTDAMMESATVDACIRAIGASSAHTVDLTGGAPELHHDFRKLVDASVDMGRHVIDRCNLTVLLLDRFEGLPEWLGERGVEIVASLPHYRSRGTDAQRGEGTHSQSIEALRLLNSVGYGVGDPKRRLTLMSNPSGAFLAGDQTALESEWKLRLREDFDIAFDRLIALNNMPISRFLDWLQESENFEPYMNRLVDAFNPSTIEGLMCRNTVSVGWDGRIFDCDFNQMLDLEVHTKRGGMTIADFNEREFMDRRIVTARHCFGCTAGCGSGCGGATA